MFRPFLDWYHENGFLVKKSWDFVNEEMAEEGNLYLFPHQERILAHCFTPDSRGNFPYSTIVYSCPKKSGKTAILAMVGAYFAEEGPDNSEIYSIANDKDQAQARAFTDLEFHSTRRPGASSTRFRIDYATGTFVEAIAHQYSSAAGGRQLLTMWDELWGFVSERSYRLWAEMIPIPTVKNSTRMITTYAGFENESVLLWDLYEKNWVHGTPVPELVDLVNTQGDPVCRANGRTFVYWDDQPRMPWQTAEYYADEMETMRPSDFLQKHRNRWVTSNEAFIPVEMWDQTVRLDSPITLNPLSPYRKTGISVGVDIGTKHDTSAVAGIIADPQIGQYLLAFHGIWVPKAGEVLDIEETVEKFLLGMHKKYKLVSVSYDPSQFLRSAVTLKKAGMPMVEFTQTNGNMTAATGLLFDLIQHRKLATYVDAEIRDHIRNSVAVQTPRGFRLVKNNAKYPIDFAVALAMACYDAVNFGGEVLGQPLQVISPFSDVSSIKIPTLGELQDYMLPPALRG